MKSKHLYWVWSAMIQRCHNPNQKQYADYGGRGITVCESWKTFENFEFDMGQKENGFYLDRIDNNQGYFKENCRWTTRISNNKNKRVYKTNVFGISGIAPREDGFRVRLRHLGKIVVDKTIDDFFEACCIRKAAELIYVSPYLGAIK